MHVRSERFISLSVIIRQDMAGCARRTLTTGVFQGLIMRFPEEPML
ncbi:MAG: hypothetical protein K0S45_2481 [Nitrospira sp.]|nr:hypothetical protein [Nitrospira sp.]